MIVVASACDGKQTTQSPAPAQMPAAKESAPPKVDAATPVDSGPKRTSPPTITTADLDRRTAELFGDALRIDARVPVPADTMVIQEVDEPTWDIEVRSYEAVDRVRYYVDAFTGRARTRFITLL